ncbi:MAG: DNA helicase RecQ [Saprospiraceae bacterium]|nr:DNA helicase RecQ [Saprospiraceae bacterium]
MEKAYQALKQYFGYDQFRPLQAEIISSIYEGKDALVLMPTGGGKSVCYQIPAITLPGTCVVVSPLISLMKDQVEGLCGNGVRAAFLNSSNSAKEQRAVEDRFFNGELDLLYVSPEKVISQGFISFLKSTPINLFAIDEAHCISAWGHDFRPEYTQLHFLKQSFPNVPVVALTATADKLTRTDIVSQLRLQDPAIYIASFDRPNLGLEVRPGQRRLEHIFDFINKRTGQPGIIYCLSRKSTEELAQKLAAKGIISACYHAGLADGERAKAQEDFIEDRVQVICATIAFGMGIDKSNVRWIIHYNLPKNLESFYQEIGRAGRDGAPADTLLFYSYHDVMVLQDILDKPESENKEIQLAKLDRMRQYAEALVCRRRILLNYFGEDFSDNCGKCDVCRNPPEYFDGTELAQKALSAVYRLREKVGMQMLIDILRGAGKKELLSQGYDQIKTYGAGRDLSAGEWQQHLSLLLNLGYIEIAHDQHHVLKLTPASKRVLFENEKVQLIRMKTLKDRQEQEKEKAQQVTVRQRTTGELFELLRQHRLKLARERGIPPYLIFSDATLEEMAAMKPLNESEMSRISGVGDFKLKEYGTDFIDLILDYVSQKGNTPQGSTYLITLEMFKSGLSVAEIAEKRQCAEITVYNHLAHLLEKGTAFNIDSIVSPAERKEIRKASKYLEQPVKLKALYELFDESVPYYKLKLAMAESRISSV